MRRTQRIVFVTAIMMALPVLAGCSSFDPDSLDLFGFGEKKKLAGDRRPVFPEGVPGVTQGVPPQYIRGNQMQQSDAALPPVDAPPPAVVVEQSRPAPKPRAARAAVAAKPKAVRAVPVQPVSEEPQQQAQPAWPAPAQQSAPPASGGTAAWPAPPPAGTFTR